MNTLTKKTIKLVHCQNWGAQFNKVDEERFFDARYFPQGGQIVAAEGQQTYNSLAA